MQVVCAMMIGMMAFEKLMPTEDGQRLRFTGTNLYVANNPERAFVARNAELWYYWPCFWWSRGCRAIYFRRRFE